MNCFETFQLGNREEGFHLEVNSLENFNLEDEKSENNLFKKNCVLP